MHHTLYERKSDDYVVEVKRRTCYHHRRQPWDRAFIGCTCSISYADRLATPEEKADNIRRRKAEEARREKYVRDFDAGLIKFEEDEKP